MKKRCTLFCIASLILLITLSIFISIIRNDFVIWDDNLIVYDNVHIRSLNLSFFKWIITNVSESGLWQPLSWITFALDYAVWGLKPEGYHLTNVVLHSVNTFLVVFLIQSLFEAEKLIKNEVVYLSPYVDNRSILIAAGVAGILFGIHPLHVESVAWISGRNALLCAFFFILSVLTYSKHSVTLAKKGIKYSFKLFCMDTKYFLSLLFYVFAVSSSPQSVTLPFVLIILDWNIFDKTSIGKSRLASLLDKLPFVAVSFFVTVATLMVQKVPDNNSLITTISFADRILVAANAIAIYLCKLLIPIHMIPYYPFPKDISITSFEYYMPLVFFVVTTIVLLSHVKKYRVITAAWLFFIVMLLPVLNIIGVRDISMADRYTYLSSLGPFMLIGLATARFWQKVDIWKKRYSMVKPILVTTAISFIFLLSYLSLKQIAVWKNSISLWSYVIQKGPYHVPIAYTNRGMAYFAEGKIDLALEDYNRAIAINSDYSNAYYNRSGLFRKIGDFDQAIVGYTKVISMNIKDVDSYINRGIVFTEKGSFDLAIKDFTVAIEINPFNFYAYTNRGSAFISSGDLERAMADINKAIELNPSHYISYNNRAIALVNMGHYREAIADYTKALSLNQSYVKAYIGRGGLYEKLGNQALALNDYQKACGLGNEEICEALRNFK